MAGIAHGGSACSVRSCSSCSGFCCSGFFSGAAFIGAGVFIRACTTVRAHERMSGAAAHAGGRRRVHHRPGDEWANCRDSGRHGRRYRPGRSTKDLRPVLQGDDVAWFRARPDDCPQSGCCARRRDRRQQQERGGDDHHIDVAGNVRRPAAMCLPGNALFTL